MTIPIAERQDDDDEVLGLEPERLLREAGPSTPSTPTSDAAIAEVDQRPADLAVAADVVEALAQLDEDRSRPRPRPRGSRPRARRPASLRRGRRGRQRRAEGRGDEVQDRDDDDQRRRAGDLHDRAGRASANPRANAAFSVSVKMPFAASSCLRGTSFGIIAASAGAKNTVTVETKMFSR